MDVAKPRVLGSINAHAVHGDDNPAMAGEHFERRKSSYVEIGVLNCTDAIRPWATWRDYLVPLRPVVTVKTNVFIFLSLRGADLSAAAPDPLRGQFLLHAVLRQARLERSEVDLVQGLVLIEAGEHVRHFAGRRIAVRLQALSADPSPLRRAAATAAIMRSEPMAMSRSPPANSMGCGPSAPLA